MGREKMLNDFWLAEENAPPPAIISRDALPSAARRYNAYAIAKNAPRVAAVKLRMHGEIKLNGWSQYCLKTLDCFTSDNKSTCTMHIHKEYYHV